MKPQPVQGKMICSKRTTVILGCIIFALFVTFFIVKQWSVDNAWKPGMPLSYERVKIGIIFLTDVTETSGYTYAHDLGIREMQKEIGLRDDQIIRKSNVSDLSPISAEQAIRECIFEGANIIIANSWGHMEACEKLASEYPNIVFAHASGHKINNANFTNYFARIYQAWYLAGIVAGLKTTTNKIGYVAAMGKYNSEVTGSLAAFAIGVEKINPKATVYVKMIHRWYDPNGEIEAARSLIMEGCDVLTNDTDTSNPMIEAQKAGIWGVGYNTDMSFDAPDAVITSVVFNWGVYYTQLIKSIIDGSFTTEPYYGGLKEGIIDLTPFNEKLLPDGAAKIVAEERNKIENGEFHIFEGTLETSDGRIIGEDGSIFSDFIIQNQIDWHYRNVVAL